MNITGIPDDATVFTITLEGGGELHGAIQLKGVYISDYTEIENSSMTGVTVIYDSPSKPGSGPLMKQNIADIQPETRLKRETRYNDDGFVIVRGSDGKKMLVPEETQARALRLAELQNDLANEEQERFAEYEAYPEASDRKTHEGEFVALWGRHILTVVVAGLVLFGIVKICF
jgi:hypothetical protein